LILRVGSDKGQKLYNNLLGVIEMERSSLNQYKGPLDPDKIVEGMNVAAENAKRLYEDAEILLEKSRYASALSLAILSIEESGKIPILREMSLLHDTKDLKEIWHRNRSHTQKNIAWILPDLVMKGANKISDLREIFNPDSDHPQILDNLKQISFYTDCLGNKNWSFPDDIIEESLAKQLVMTAKVFVPKSEKSAKEIELWQKHLGPIWKGVVEGLKPEDIDRLQIAVEDFEEEMLELGIKLDTKNKLSDFIKNQKIQLKTPNKTLHQSANDAPGE